MLPCLLLALALLGTASASHLALASPKAVEPVPEAPGEDVARCPLASETRAFKVHHPRGATTFRFVVVTRCQTFDNAQHVCARCYGGRLASIHSYDTNTCLQHQARLITRRGQVWIGAVTQPAGHTVWCHWADRTPWDFSRWVPGSPLHSRRACTALCTNDGRWRSLRCRLRLPFICEY